MNTALRPYGSGSAHSGITHFALLPQAIIVLFQDGSAYLYTDDLPGKQHIRHMRALAEAGQGLTTYINQKVRSNYAESLTADQVRALRHSISPAPAASASSPPSRAADPSTLRPFAADPATNTPDGT